MTFPDGQIQEGFQISSFGRLSVKKRVWCGRLHNDRLRTVVQRREFNIHVLVCSSFHGKRPFPEAVVRHLDNNPLNNLYTNLSWGSRQENVRDSLAKALAVQVDGKETLDFPSIIEASKFFSCTTFKISKGLQTGRALLQDGRRLTISSAPPRPPSTRSTIRER